MRLRKVSVVIVIGRIEYRCWQEIENIITDRLNVHIYILDKFVIWLKIYEILKQIIKNLTKIRDG